MSGFEVIGAVAAAGQFVEQGSKAIGFIKAVYDQVRDGPDSIRSWVGELESLKTIAKQVEAQPQLQTQDVAAILARWNSRIGDLVKILDRINFGEGDKVAKKTWRAVVGVATEGEINAIFSALEREKTSLLNLRLGAMSITFSDFTSRLATMEAKIDHIGHAPPGGSNEDACLSALFQTDPAADRAGLLTLKGTIVPGTCDWVLGHQKFLDWECSEGGILWISGGPGMGKTMLSIHLTEHLEKCNRDSTDHDGGLQVTTFFFCDNKDKKKNTSVAILRGLLFRLLSQAPRLIAHILPRFKVQGKSLFAEESFEGLWMIFTSMVSDPILHRISCVIDGLDECDMQPLQALLVKIEDGSNALPRLRLIVVSREHPKILETSLGRFPRIRLDPDAIAQVNAGLEKYITVSVEKLASNLGRSFSPVLRQRVEETLRNKSEGRFLWVSFVVQDLRDIEACEIEERLLQLPKGLNDLYGRMLGQVKEPDRQSIVRKLLTWCAFAVRPLRPEDLVDILGIKNLPDLTPVDIIRGYAAYTGHFLVVDDLTDRTLVQLVHQSAKDYLVGRTVDSAAADWFPPFETQKTNAELTSKCLDLIEETWASLDRWRPDVLRDRYWFRNWPDHARLSGLQLQEVINQHHDFFAKDSEVREQWTFRGHLPPLHFACALGLDVLALWIINKKKYRNRMLGRFASVNKMDSDNMTALQWAALEGNVSTAKILLENGAKVFVKDPMRGDCRNDSLVYFIFRDCLEGVKLFIDHGVSRELVICRAVMANSETIVSFLLSGDIDLSKAGLPRRRVNVLHLAAKHSSPCLKLLLRHKQGPGLLAHKDVNGSDALHYACEGLNNGALLELLDPKWGLDPTRVNKLGQTLLHVSMEALGGTIADDRAADLSARLLWIDGIDVNGVDNDGDTALHLFCRALHYQDIAHDPVDREIFLMLLEAGANSTLKNRRGQTPRDEILDFDGALSAFDKAVTDLAPAQPDAAPTK